MDASFDTIRDGFERLRAANRQPKVFGAEMHAFKLNPRLSESAVQKLKPNTTSGYRRTTGDF